MYMYVLFCSFIFTFHYFTYCTRCSGSGYTSRWYHMSDGEHFCNACFDHMYRRYVSLNINFNDHPNLCIVTKRD